MYGLNLAENIIRLRHERKITQEELAAFVGVTKASVSKWENNQSIPDLMILLQLAAFFDVTVDELLGYEPQLSKDQIRHYYAGLSEDFVRLPFHEVLEKIRSLAHRYYSCYPFLLELSVLYLNHYMLAGTQEEQTKLIKEAAAWCDHILKHCTDVGVCKDALIIKAWFLLLLGRAEEVVEILESSADPTLLAKQEGALMVQAYQMTGRCGKARSYIQIRQYLDLLNLVGDAMLSLSLYEDDLARCEETICRAKGVMDQYQLERLHPNVAAQFYYQCAAVYAVNGKNDKAAEALESFGQCIDRLLNIEPLVLHGDEYFDLLDEWIERLPLGDMVPRNKEFVGQNVREALQNPVFEGMKEEKVFQRFLHRFERREDHA